jgi:tetrahydromethanopterin S-methyltransferase subunit A
VLDCVIEGATPSAVGATAVERGLVLRLDHAVYLGRELARAEESLRTRRRSLRVTGMLWLRS